MVQNKLIEKQHSQALIQTSLEKIVKEKTIEITQLERKLGEQSNEISQLSVIVKYSRSIGELHKHLNSQRNHIKSESILLKQQIITDTVESTILRQILQRDVKDAMILNACEISMLKEHLDKEKQKIGKYLNNEDIVNNELIQLLEKLNEERSNAKSLVEKTTKTVEIQRTRFLEKMIKKSLASKDALKKCENAWSHKYCLLNAKIKVRIIKLT